MTARFNGGGKRWGIILLLWAGLTGSLPWVHATEPATVGREAFERGAFDTAIHAWDEAARQAEADGNTAGWIDALIALGDAHVSLGQQKLAVDDYEQAVRLAEQHRDRPRLTLAQSSLGIACLYARLMDRAEQNLRESLARARADHDAGLMAVALNNLGVFLAEQNQPADAGAAFQESATLTRTASNNLLAAKALSNAAATADRVEAIRLNTAALETIRQLPASHDQALLLIKCGRTAWRMSRLEAAPNQDLLKVAEQSFAEAQRVAEQIGDAQAKTYTLGYWGRVLEARHEIEQALALTRQAVFFAQEIQSPDALYRWEWQTGRLLRAVGDRPAAIAAYRRTVQTLQPIHRDLSFGYCAACAPFREAVGPVYTELADLLLQQAAGQADAGEREQTLRAARDAIEQLKSVELEDYFEDECVNLLRSKLTRLESVSPTTAVIYIIPLPDRTELLIGLRGGLQAFQTPVGAAELTAKVREFRLHLEKKTTNQYLVEARQLYQWLIAPIQPMLAEHHIDTLVFVPDGALRTVPMAALHDGKQFLAEQFATAVAPSLTLVEPRPLEHKGIDVLVAGLSEATQGFPALPYVSAELAAVHSLFGGQELVNQDFRFAALQKDFKQNQYEIAHFATHAKFDKKAGNTFVLTYDGRLSLDQLESLIRPSQYRGKPMELLTLSACQTAAGDDRAALGLAGVAVKAGARSALATLWYVNDESTARLIRDFYSQLQHSRTLSKAQALQRAQVKLLTDPAYEHPGYWAPFLIIGNWL